KGGIQRLRFLHISQELGQEVFRFSFNTKKKNMNKYIRIIILLFVVFTGCQKLDLDPLSEGSSENWYSNEKEIEFALNDLYRPDLWYVEGARVYNTDRFTDDWNQREYLYDYVAGTITSDWSDSKNTWI